MPKKKLKKLLMNFNKLLFRSNDAYLQINLIFAGIIIAMLLYSGIFSSQGISHPIKSATNETTISTGLSRAFSEIVRLNISEAKNFNPYSIPIFLFFFIQLFMRIASILLLLSTRFSRLVLIISDILTSLLLFLGTYYRFIADQL